jgi:hypothetical protein
MTDSLRNINAIRTMLGLKPIVWKTTNCLSCTREFESRDYPRQRLCIHCRQHTDDFLEFSIPSSSSDYSIAL